MIKISTIKIHTPSLRVVDLIIRSHTAITSSRLASGILGRIVLQGDFEP